MKDTPRIGTNNVPSVENRAGCKKVGGKWNISMDACLLYDNKWTDYVGFTAPMKGTFSWWRVDEAPVDNGPGIYKGVVGMNLVANSKEYPVKIDTSASFIKDSVEGRFQNAKDFYDLIRLNGVTLIKELHEGKHPEWQYFTPDGNRTEPHRVNAVGVNLDVDGSYVKSSYKKIKKITFAPFKIRNIQDVPMRPHFTMDYPWLKHNK